MSSTRPKIHADELVGAEVKALKNTPTAYRGESGEIVRADKDECGFTVLVEWRGSPNQAVRLDAFDQSTLLTSLTIERRSS